MEEGRMKALLIAILAAVTAALTLGGNVVQLTDTIARDSREFGRRIAYLATQALPGPSASSVVPELADSLEAAPARLAQARRER